MAINKNHEFEELNGVKCAVVERNVAKERTDFLKQLLEYNHYTVVVIPTPPPPVKAAPAKPVPAPSAPDKESEQPMPVPAPEPQPETFTVGVTDVTFNSINAIFGRSLIAPGGHIVTLAYWQQQEKISRDDVPYFDMRE